MDRNLYIADTNNSALRKVVLATSVVTTVAGHASMTGSIDGVGSADENSILEIR